MAVEAPRFTVGIEEEYLLVDRATRDLAADPPASLMAECEKRLEGQVKGLLRLEEKLDRLSCRLIDRTARRPNVEAWTPHGEWIAHLEGTIERLYQQIHSDHGD